MAQPAQNPDSGTVHDLAVDTAQDLHLLATKLAHAGASPQAVQGLQQMAAKIDQVVKVLAQSPEVEQAAQHGAAAAGPPPGGPAGPPPGGPAQPGQGGLAPGAPGGPPPGGSFGPATQQLHQAMQQRPPQR